MKRNLLLLIVILCTALISGQNLLENPGFETWENNKPTKWTFSNTTYITQNDTEFLEGNTSYKSNTVGVNQNISASQSIAVTQGKTYTFSVSYLVERGDGTDAQISCNFRNSEFKNIKMSLADSLALKGPGGSKGYLTTELGIWKTYTCDVVAPEGATIFYFSIRSLPYSIVSWDNFSFSVNNTPTIYVSKTELINFNYLEGAGPSSEKTFEVKGSNLSKPITITAPLNYEISTTSGSLFFGTNTITLPQTNGIVSPVTIYTRLKSNLSSNNYSGSISIVSDNVPTQTVALEGLVGIPTASINTSVSSLSGYTFNQGSGPSTIKSFTVSGSQLSSGITITAPEGYEISILTGLNFLGYKSFTISQSNGMVGTTTIYTRLKAGLTEGSYIGNLSLSSGATTKTILLTGAVITMPEISISTNTLNGFRYTPGNGPSEEQSFSVSCKGMSKPLTITAPANYEISTQTGTSYEGVSELMLAHTNGLIAPTQIYVRLKNNLTEGNYAGILAIRTSSGISKSISLDGNVSVTEEITVSTEAISDLSYVIGSGPSVQKSFTLSAKGLITALTVVSPENFEISTVDGNSFTYNDILILPINAGRVANTTIYIRLKEGLEESASYTGSLGIYSGGESKNITVSGYVNGIPEITVSTTALSGFTYKVGIEPSTIQSFTVSATKVITGLSITAPYGYEISTKTGSSFEGSSNIELRQSGNLIQPTLIYVRLENNLTAGTYSGDLYIEADNGITKSISLSGVVIIPEEITVSTNTISDLFYVVGSGPSAQKSFTLSAKGLVATLTLTAPVNYEISTVGGSLFTGNTQLVLTPNAGSIANTTIYIRLKAGLAKSNSYTGNITFSSGSISKNIAVSGYVNGLPEITVSTAALSVFNYKIGNGPSNQQLFTVSGINLQSGITINAPAGYELSTIEGVGSIGTSMLVIPASNGNVITTEIFVRLKSGLEANTYIGQIQVSTIGQISKTISLNGRVEMVTDISNVDTDKVKVYSNLNLQQIIVQGVNSNDTVELFSISGKFLKKIKPTSDTLEIPVRNHTAYIVRINSKAYKVVL